MRMAFFIIFSLLSLSAIHHCYCDAPFDYTETNALIAFKNALQDPLGNLATWDPNSVDPCTWLHVDCNQNTRVVSLFMADLGLSGSLVPELAMLKSLQRLILERNMLYGSIPKALGSLSNLFAIDLFSNKLTGPIPVELGNATNLQIIRAHDNQLSGVIPFSLTTLPLGILNLSNNNLEGPIPNQGCFRNFDASSFLGNPRLCGAQIRKRC